MPGLRGIQRKNFRDSVQRRNWNKLATWLDRIFSSEQFQLGPNGELQLAGGLVEKFSAYDASGEMEVTAEAKTVLYDTLGLNSNDAVFSAFVDGELTITINSTEGFSFSATVTVRHYSLVDPDFQCRIYLELNDGGGWVEVPGSSVTLGNKT